jgi:DNA mismatch repair protein MLH1
MRPKPIVRLSPDVVNRVAAGEVIHRPASALKEMLENSLDAGSRSITVTVRDGGNKLLQVTDDGCGIRDEDMSILCERHTTSKLRTFEDLDAVATFGFRGEALASMSFVANLTVTTMTAGAAHATRAAYADGKMTPEGPRPTAGVPGTTVCVENLFYNVPTRRRALRSASEEYARVLETTQRYAASRPDVAFTVRKLGDARPALRCPSVCAVDDTRMTNGNGTPAGVARNPRVDRLRAIYGDTTARCLAPLAFSAGGWTGASVAPSTVVSGDATYDAQNNQTVRFAVDALVSTASYHSKKTTFILFINDRLVECAPLRRACELAYAAFSPKSERPFLFVALALPRDTVDVNVHPTKREVRFLHQDEIVESVATRLAAVLEANNETRAFRRSERLNATEDDAEKTFFESLESNGAATERRQTAETNGVAPRASTRSTLHAGGDGTAKGGKAPVSFSLTHVREPTDPDLPAKRAKTTTRDLVARDHKLVRVDANQAAGSLDAFFPRTTPGAPAPARGVAETPRRRTVAGSVHRSVQPEVFAANAANAARADDARASDGDDTRKHSKTSGEAREDGTAAPSSRPEPGVSDPAFLAAAAAADGETSPLSSVRELWGEIRAHAHAGLTQMVRNMVLVGVCDPGDPDGLWLIQHATKLSAVRFRTMAREFFFQRVVARFGAHRTRRLAERAPISDLVVLALDLERDEDGDGGELADPRVARVADAARTSVAEKAPLLGEYFGVDVDAASGSITGLPVLVEGFEPDLRGLPEFALALAHDVDWTEEKACFRTVADALATFYADSFDSRAETEREASVAESETETRRETEETERVRAIKQFVFPAMRRCLYPSKVAAVQGVATQVASLEQLYRVFERC